MDAINELLEDFFSLLEDYSIVSDAYNTQKEIIDNLLKQNIELRNTMSGLTKKINSLTEENNLLKKLYKEK